MAVGREVKCTKRPLGHHPVTFLALSASIILLHQPDTKFAYAGTDYSLDLFEGQEPSDGTIGLNQLVRAVVTVEILIDVTVQTDKASYTTGDDITITGKVGPVMEGQPVLIRVLDPDGALARIDPVSVEAGGAYTYTFPSGGPLMSQDGDYTVIATYRGTNEETTFFFEASGIEGKVADASSIQGDQVAFRWINPSGDVVRYTTAHLSPGVEDTFAPDLPGDWTVEAEISIGGVAIETVSSTLSVGFFVLPESPIGAIAIVTSSFAVLGLFIKLRNDSGNNKIV